MVRPWDHLRRCWTLWIPLLPLFSQDLMEKEMATTPVLLPGKSHGWRSLVGYSPWGLKESDTTKWLHFQLSLSCIGEGNGNPLQYSCLKNPRDRGAWWTAVHGVAQGQMWLKRLSSSSQDLKVMNQSGHLPVPWFLGEKSCLRLSFSLKLLICTTGKSSLFERVKTKQNNVRHTHTHTHSPSNQSSKWFCLYSAWTYFFKKLIYLVVSSLGCGMWDLYSCSMWIYSCGMWTFSWGM